MKPADPSNQLPSALPQAGQSASPDAVDQQIAAMLARSTQIEQQLLPEAIALVRDALSLAHSTPAPAAELDCMLRLTDLLQQHGDHTQALDYGLQVLARLAPDRCDVLTCRFLHALGRTYAVISEYEHGLVYVRQAYDMARSLPDPTTEAYVYLTLSLIYSRINQGEAGRTAIASGLAMPEFEQLQPRLRAFLLHDAASNAASDGDLDSAFVYIERAQALWQEGWLFCTHASFLHERGDIAGARRLFEQALASVPSHDYQTRAYVQCEAARLLIDIGEAAAGEALLRDVLDMPNVEYTFRESALEQLSQYRAGQGDYQAAYQHQLKRQQLLNDHVQWQTDMRSRALDGQFRNELARRDAELARREQQALHERTQLLEQHLRERTQALEQQQQLLQMITELSTPVLPLVPGVLVLPIIGTVDSQRMLRMVGSVLEDVSRHRAHALILDITGVPLVDTQVAAAFLELARAVKLLGCRCVLVGIRPEIAQALVGLGITLGELTTRAGLPDGLAAVGVRIQAARVRV